MNVNECSNLGCAMRDLILYFARLLSQDWLPGTISLFILGFLAVFVLFFLKEYFSKVLALNWLCNEIAQIGKGGDGTSESVLSKAHIRNWNEILNQGMTWNRFRILIATPFGLAETVSQSIRLSVRPTRKAAPPEKGMTEDDYLRIHARFQDVKKGGLRGKEFERIAFTWDEFRETLVLDDIGEPPVFRNSVRPSVFFNTDDLNFGAGFYRFLPGLFVTVGLLFTFLGLISALDATVGLLPNSQGDTVNNSNDALKTLLDLATAKFIMSLTGLFASIFFTIVLRTRMGKLELAMHRLCVVLEGKLSFVSLESVAIEQLKTSRGYEDSFQRIGTSLVEELGRPLREDLPAAVSNSIKKELEPILEHFSQIGLDGMNEMAQKLSSQLSHNLEKSLAEASDRIKSAGDQFVEISNKMDQSSERMKQETEDSVERLLGVVNQSLEGIKANTVEGSEALKTAAEDMRNSASAFRTEIDKAAEAGAGAVRDRMKEVAEGIAAAVNEASKNMVHAVNAGGEEMLAAVNSFKDKLRDELVAPIDAMIQHLDRMNISLQDGSTQISTAVAGIQKVGEASSEVAEKTSDISQALQAATEPLQQTLTQVENAVTNLSESTTNASDVVVRSATEIAQTSAKAFEQAVEILSGEQMAIDVTLGNLRIVMEKMNEQEEKITEIDQKLGVAFKEFKDQVGNAVDALHGHVGRINQEMAPAIDKLREVVDQAEKFMPEKMDEPRE